MRIFSMLLIQKKNLHYYRCSRCTGVCLNAHTTPHTKKKSAEFIFIELLKQYQIPKNLVPLIELQLTKLLKHYNDSDISCNQELERQHNALQKVVKDLRIRLGLGKIGQETFDLRFDHINEQIQKISKEWNNPNNVIFQNNNGFGE